MEGLMHHTGGKAQICALPQRETAKQLQVSPRTVKSSSKVIKRRLISSSPFQAKVIFRESRTNQNPQVQEPPPARCLPKAQARVPAQGRHARLAAHPAFLALKTRETRHRLRTHPQSERDGKHQVIMRTFSPCAV